MNSNCKFLQLKSSGIIMMMNFIIWFTKNIHESNYKKKYSVNMYDLKGKFLCVSLILK
jgi:hypothetical protein